MLDGLLGRGFSSKCKSLIKATRTRIEMVRKRAEAKQKFLKEDLAKFLSNGLDINAYGRTEEFIAGLSLLSCYDFIEESCDYIVKQLSKMQKSGECPEECREAVASLMFAAARFSDMPELRDLRDAFQERYSSLECFVNKKFIEKLSSRPPTTEKRLQVLEDIASEFSINWNRKGFEKRMAAPALPQVTISEREIPKHRHEVLNDRNQQDGNVVKRNESEREKSTYCKQNSLVKQEDSTSNRGQGILLHERQGLIEDKHLTSNEKDDVLPKGVRKSSPSRRVIVDNIGGRQTQHNNGVITRKEQTVEAVSLEKPVIPPPPYVKSKETAILPRPPYTKPKEDKHRSKSFNSLVESHKEPDHHVHEGKNLGLVKIDINGNEKETDYQDNPIPLPKPRSIRRKHQKSSSNHDSVGNLDDVSSSTKRSSSSRRRDYSRKGLQILFDDEHQQNDEEERVIDKLLIHYSKKPSSYDAGKVKKKLLAQSSHQRAIQRAIDVEPEVVPQPSRSISLPHTESGSQPVKKVFTRAITFHPDNQARHVHPNLPDYDDLAARIAALGGQ